MKKELLKKIGIVLLAVVIVGYLVVTLFKSNLSPGNMVETQIATRYKYSESLNTSATVIRSESYVTYDGSGVLYYMVDDGDNVGVGSVVARVFANETDALNYKNIRQLDSRIEVLNKLNTSYENVKTDYSAVDNQISLNLKSLISAVNSGSQASVEKSGDSLIYSVNQRQIITGVVKSYKDQIDALKQQRESLVSSGGSYTDEIKSSVAGYFVTSADGYETAYDYKTAPDMSIEQLGNKPSTSEVGSNVIGKVISKLNWYVVCSLSADDALSLSHSDNQLLIKFPNSAGDAVPAQLVSLNQVSKQSEAVAVFSCNYMSSALSRLRDETIQIIINDYDGIIISKSALHDDYVDVAGADEDTTGTKKKVQGVYVLHGSKLEFREISIMYAGSDFIIADDSPPEGTLVSSETIRLNDEVVVSGGDLYAGKIVK